MEAFMKNINKVFDVISYFVAAVAGISLFIAGIGVMNVMYISVTERTEEIAIRRAFGAKARDIEVQFLVESVVLCVIGGIIGLIKIGRAELQSRFDLVCRLLLEKKKRSNNTDELEQLITLSRRIDHCEEKFSS